MVLLHKDLPNLGPVDSAHYISVLADAVADWKPDEPHELVVIFPKSAETEVRRLLQQTALSPDSESPPTPRG